MVVVITGGNSKEREVSLKSAQAVFESLQKQGIESVLFDWRGDNFSKILTLNPERVFIAVHGKGGEDGVLQQLLEEHNIAYSGSGVQASHIAMDKAQTQTLLAQHHLPVAAHYILRRDHPLPTPNFPPPYAVKPTTEGSSIGISKADATTLDEAIATAFCHSDEVLIEQWIAGRELTVAVLEIEGKPQALSVVEIQVDAPFYDYHAKYESNTTHYTAPADISTELTQTLQQLALQAFTTIGCKGWARVDFLLDATTHQPYILEINTVPGMTSHSLVPMSAKASGIDFDALVLAILDA